MQTKEIDLGQMNGEPVRLLVGYQPIILIDKLYGPTGGRDIKIELDTTVWQWVISQEVKTSPPNTDSVTIWKERARIDLQPFDDTGYYPSEGESTGEQ